MSHEAVPLFPAGKGERSLYLVPPLDLGRNTETEDLERKPWEQPLHPQAHHLLSYIFDDDPRISQCTRMHASALTDELIALHQSEVGHDRAKKHNPRAPKVINYGMRYQLVTDYSRGTDLETLAQNHNLHRNGVARLLNEFSLETIEAHRESTYMTRERALTSFFLDYPLPEKSISAPTQKPKIFLLPDFIEVPVKTSEPPKGDKYPTILSIVQAVEKEQSAPLSEAPVEERPIEHKTLPESKTDSKMEASIQPTSSTMSDSDSIRHKRITSIFNSLTADQFVDFMKIISDVPVLEAEEEVSLAKSIEAGLYASHLLSQAEQNGTPLDEQKKADLQEIARLGNQDRDFFIISNLKLIVKAAKEYKQRPVEQIDLIQNCVSGLMRALITFDYKKGLKFSTYAMTWILRDRQNSFHDYEQPIRLPRHMARSVDKMNAVTIRLSSELGRPPSNEELAREMNVSPEKLEKIKAADLSVSSLSEFVEGKDGDLITLEDRLITTPQVEPPAMSEATKKHLAMLEPEEYEVLNLRLALEGGYPLVQDKVADIMKITRSRVRSIEKSALKKLRNLQS